MRIKLLPLAVVTSVLLFTGLYFGWTANARETGLSSGDPVPIPAAPGDLVISQIYGGGGLGGATYRNSYVEIFNRNSSPVLTHSYAIALGIGVNPVDRSYGAVNSRGFVIQPGQYILIKLGSGGASGAEVLQPDLEFLPAPPAPSSYFGLSGKLALAGETRDNSIFADCPLTAKDLSDFVGFGSTNCFEGSGPITGLTVTKAALRKGNGCTDTNNNAADFTVGTPNPRNSNSPYAPCAPPPTPTPTPTVTPTPTPTPDPTPTPTPTPDPTPTPTPVFGPPAILFTSNRDGNNEIYRMNADGTDQRRLTNDAANDSNAKWSPDGTKIAFARRFSSTSQQLWTVNADGTGETLVSDTDGVSILWDWSPDGSKILYGKNSGGTALPVWTMNPDGTEKLQITTPGDLQDLSAVWSPDGSRIAFGRCPAESASCDIWSVNTNGSSAVNLTSTNPTRNDGGPQFTPDGNKILFQQANEAGTKHDLVIMSKDGSGQVPLTNIADGYGLLGTQVSPDGKRAIVTQNAGTQTTFDILRVSLTQGGFVNLTNNSVFDSGGLWSPDGSRIVFQSTRDAAAVEIYTMNADGSGVLRLTTNNASDTVTDWYHPPRKGSTPYDFDGDGKADVAVYRPEDGNWYVYGSTAGFMAATWGNATDKLVPADYDGDGKTDFAIFRDGVFWILNSSTGVPTGVPWGLATDTPVPADYDGDGKADPAIFRDGVWAILGSTQGYIGVPWGLATDTPVPADYDGDGKADVAIFRDGIWAMLGSTQGYMGLAWGMAGDKPIPADYDGDGKADPAIFREGIWAMLGSTQGYMGLAWGLPTDTPVPADYDGDGKADPAIYRDGVWAIYGSTSGYIGTLWGLGSDIPLSRR